MTFLEREMEGVKPCVFQFKKLRVGGGQRKTDKAGSFFFTLQDEDEGKTTGNK